MRTYQMRWHRNIIIDETLYYSVIISKDGIIIKDTTGTIVKEVSSFIEYVLKDNNEIDSSCTGIIINVSNIKYIHICQQLFERVFIGSN